MGRNPRRGRTPNWLYHRRWNADRLSFTRCGLRKWTGQSSPSPALKDQISQTQPEKRNTEGRGYPGVVKPNGQQHADEEGWP